VAEALRIDRSALARIESGERQLSAIELYALAALLGFPLSHFVSPAPVAIASHRQDISDDADEVSRTSFLLDARMQAHARDAEWLRGRGYLASSRVDLAAVFDSGWGDADGDKSRWAAGEVRRALGIQGPVGRMVDAISTAGLFAVVLPDLPGGASLLLDDGFGVAVVGAADDVVRRRMTAAHELGHFVLRDEYRTDIGVSASRDEREQHIEAFAAEFLLPTSALEEAWTSGTGSSRARLVRLSCVYGASWSATVTSAQRLGVLEPGQLAALRADSPTLGEMIELSGSAPTKDLPVGDTATMWRQAVIAAYRDGAINAHRAVELVHGALAVEDLPDPARSDEW
jgi:transcriptional regulator with XRE-family HTH domain